MYAALGNMPEYAHVKNNKLSREYREAIIKLVCAHGVEKVTVQMILDETETSRATFYTYFRDKFALMHYVYYHAYMYEQPKKTDPSYAVYNSHMDYYKKLFQHEGQNSFREFYESFWMNYYKNICSIVYEREMTFDEEMIIKVYIAGMYVLKREWVMYNRDLSPEYVHNLLASFHNNAVLTPFLLPQFLEYSKKAGKVLE